MTTRHLLYDTLDQMTGEQLPNFLRLYLNPFVVQTCLSLSRYVQEAWHVGEAGAPEYQSFLANSFDEALSGAIKLARYDADATGRPKAGLVCDPEGRVGPLVFTTGRARGASQGRAGSPLASAAGLPDHPGQDRTDFIPEITVRAGDIADASDVQRVGFVVVFPSADHAPVSLLEALSHRQPRPLVLACVHRAGLAHCLGEASSPWRTLRPDVVVFDDSFVHHDVPFGAFTARRSLYDHWNKPGHTTFHSTTYQPNCISSLHFLKCLEQDAPDFLRRLAPQFERIGGDLLYRKQLCARLYSPSLARMTAAVGWNVPRIRAAGHYLDVHGRQVFDAVAGVACSVRGHNPPTYRAELERLTDLPDEHAAAAERLGRLTGLGRLVPAVSGASAVENALRLGLAAQFPKKYVLAFRGGFGGKTLLALTGTANRAYKTGLDPLYEHVVYVDPFAASAIEELEATLDKYPVGMVQLELVQAVGGVRALPEKVIHYLQEEKRRRGYLLFVDEVQTAMYRTGPFCRSQQLGIEPDLMTVGKGTADMMIPFAVTLYSEQVRDQLAARHSDLPEALRRRCAYPFGYRTLINVLDRAAEMNDAQRVREAGELFARRLGEGLRGCRAVRDVRVFGLLIGIELDTSAGPRKWFRKQAGSLYVMNLLKHKPFPVFVGYCQYEPHVLKLTPPLSITTEEVERVCAAVVAVLRRPTYQLLPSLGGVLVKSFVKGKWESYWGARVKA
jgi:acetylornithine/succinyldiaminopimelate/putrescine aminotransferase